MTEKEAINLLIANYPALDESIYPETPTTFVELRSRVRSLAASGSLGDTLVLFVAEELSDTYDSADPASSVAHAMSTAAEELQTIVDAFEKAKGE